MKYVLVALLILTGCATKPEPVATVHIQSAQTGAGKIKANSQELQALLNRAYQSSQNIDLLLKEGR